MYRLLSSQGTITDIAELEALKLDAATILQLYDCMVHTRCFTEKATAEGSLKRMPIYISPKGQEAAEVASAYALGTNDWAFWYARSQGAAFARGVSYEAMFQLFYGAPDPDVVQHFLDRNVMLPYILVGAHLPHAVGFSLGQKMAETSARPSSLAAQAAPTPTEMVEARIGADPMKPASISIRCCEPPLPSAHPVARP